MNEEFNDKCPVCGHESSEFICPECGHDKRLALTDRQLSKKIMDYKHYTIEVPIGLNILRLLLSWCLSILGTLLLLPAIFDMFNRPFDKFQNYRGLILTALTLSGIIILIVNFLIFKKFKISTKLSKIITNIDVPIILLMMIILGGCIIFGDIDSQKTNDLQLILTIPFITLFNLLIPSFSNLYGSLKKNIK